MMDRYEKSAKFIMKRGDEIIAKRKRRRAVLLRSLAVGAGAAAILGIGLTTYALRPPKKPTPNQSGIIAETETTSAETTAAPTSPSTTAPGTSTAAQTTAATTAATTASARSTAAAVRTTVTATHSTVTSAATTRATVTTTATHTTSATTAVTTATAPAQTTAATTQTTATSSQTTTNLTFATTTFAPRTTKHTGTTTTSENAYNGRNYLRVRIGNSTTEYVKTKSEWEYKDKYIKTAFIHDVNLDPSISETAQVFTISGVSEKCAVTMFFPSAKARPVYINTEYEPDTLGDMLDDMGLSTYMSFGSESARVLNEDGFRDVSNGIWQVLEDCRDAVNTKEKASAFPRDLTVYANIEYIDYGSELVISEQGYITTNIIDKGAAFYVGEEKAHSCIEYLLGT